MWLLGDINLDISKQPAFGTKKLLEDVKTFLTDKGWNQLIKGPTRFEHTVMGEKESMLDLIFTKKPEKVSRSGTEVCSGSDHALIWMHRVTREMTKKPKKTMKRSCKNYNEADLKLAANMTDWRLEVGDTMRSLKSRRNKEEILERELEIMTIKLETNIRECMDIVAPMKVISMKKKKAEWITEEILEQRRSRERLRAKARRTKKEED